MSYRDELDAAHARVAALEVELERTRAERDEARGIRPATTALVPTGGEQALVRGTPAGAAAPRWLGGPAQVAFQREVVGDLPESSHTELIECMRQALGTVGTTTVLPGSLAWTTNAPSNSLMAIVSVYMTSRDGHVKIRAEQRLGPLIGAIYGGVGGGVGGGGLVLPVAVAMVNPVLVPVALAGWLGATYMACRRLFRSRARKHANRLDKLVDDLAEITARHIARTAAAAASGND
ncbi:MAG: hypothetical protein H6708_27540 [Kofleriaceae bacterium]|nr:hypothetical protein [Kofleriaceae bacterium]